MKKEFLFAVAFLFGAFILLNTPLLGQSTGIVRVGPDIEVPELPGLPDFEHNLIFATSSSSERNTKLTLSKEYNGESTSKTGTFNVEEGVRKIRMAIHGSVKAGKINLELYLPGKKVLKKLSIDDSADIEWSQSLNIKEGDDRYYGEWTYVINAQNAEGHYRLSLSTY